MLLFHKHNKSLKVINPLTSNRRFESPSVSGTLATEEDILNFTIPSVISKPVITFPANNSIDYENNISFTPYKTIDEYTGVHTGTEVEVALDNTFDNIIINESYIADSTDTMRLPVNVSNTTVYIRIRYISNKHVSPWSEPLKVKTKQFKINIPTIITPINNSTGVPKNIVITTSSFSYVGVEDEHISTTYQLATDINFVNIPFNTTSVDKLTSIIASLNEGTTYYIRVRHNGKKYGSSDWSSTFKVSTIVPVALISSSVVVTETHSNNLGKTARFRLNNDGTTRVSRKDAKDGSYAGPRLFSNATGQQLSIRSTLVSAYMAGNSYGMSGQEISIYKTTASKTRVYIIVDYAIYDNSKNYLFTIRVNFGFVKR